MTKPILNDKGPVGSSGQHRSKADHALLHGLVAMARVTLVRSRL